MSYTPRQRQAHVRSLQEALYGLTRDDSTQPTLIPDGNFGPETTAAVRNFQRKNGLADTGNVDRETWNRIFEAYYRNLLEQSQPVAIVPFRQGPISLPVGSESGAVGLIQSMLWCLSRRFQNVQAVPVTFVLDEETLRQIQNVQRIGGGQPSDTLTSEAWNQVVLVYNATCAE